MTTTRPLPVAQAAWGQLAGWEACTLLSAASSEPLRDAQAVRVGDTIIVTADITATYVYQVHPDNEGDADGGVDSGTA
jgi:hypothetical protein